MTSDLGEDSPPRAPTLLTAEHRVEAFHCGEESLDDWLKRRALRNQEAGASRTYVVSDATQRVIAYYALATGAVAHAGATSQARRYMPDPIPVVVLGRLAVDKNRQGQGLGSDLLADAIKRTLQAADFIGIRALVVHALSGSAKRFYERHGSRSSLTDPMDLMITLREAAAILQERE